ncbi:MAG: hypothetical protein F7C08_04015 [Desulfurococcales archaeon]|nr:hypothetical protein [Desulfurococcales archaeon]MCE4605679.1 hypothetical protein [Desulfurococcales archaeon]
MNSECRLLIRGGASRIDEILDEVKYKIYSYNTRISHTGYYLKPVHKVYRRLSDGAVKVYEYYGRYYWRKQGKKLVYAGTEKPRGLPEPEPTPLDGLAVIRVGEDIVIDCMVYDKYKDLFHGLKVERY